MNKFLITGVSSGIGRALTKRLISNGAIVWGIARREKLLKSLSREVNSKKFIYSVVDQSRDNDWKTLLKQFGKRKFIPDIIVFNAAVSENDLKDGINLMTLEKMIKVNFLGVISGIHNIIPIVKPKVQFIAISTFSALKGSGTEGIGYASSKAALSIAFESLYQKYKKKGIIFKTIFFGPINSGMGPFRKSSPFILSEKSAVDFIIDAVKKKNSHHYHPKIIFFVFRIIRLLPSEFYFKILSIMESVHMQLRKKDVN